MLNSDILFKPVLVVLSAFAAWMFVYSAWISDDALISLRQVVMFGEGHGMVWNLGQRVQAFSHTSWFFLLTAGYLLTGSLFYMTLTVSGLCVAGALILYWRHCRAMLSGWAMVVLMVLPLTSSAFRDYMSSGLENPLSFLLAAAIICLALNARSKRQDQALWLLFALAILTRQDHVLHFGSLAVWVLLSGGVWRQIHASLPGLILLIGWFVFATFYFGTPLPNTYYAKLSAGVPAQDVEALANAYLFHSINLRMGTVLVVGLGLLVSIIGSPVSRALAIGIALHLYYLWSIGGDFMVGRFLAVDFFIACFILADAARRIPQLLAMGLGTVLALAVLNIERPFFIETSLDKLVFTRVIDERLMFASVYGLMSPNREWPVVQPIDPYTSVEHVYVGCGFIGGARFSWPDSVHIVDMCGLTDPYIARLPIYHDQLKKAGHFKRAVPLDYAQWILDRAPPSGGLGGSRDLLAETWALSHDSLTSAGRISSIADLNFGRHEVEEPYWVNPETNDETLVREVSWVGERPDGYPLWVRPSEAHNRYFDRLFSRTSTADRSIVAHQSPE